MQLVYIVHEIYEALEKGNEIKAVFLDTSRAFDRVQHRGLLAKLRSFGLEGNMMNWFGRPTDYKQQVDYFQCTSSTIESVKQDSRALLGTRNRHIG